MWSAAMDTAHGKVAVSARVMESAVSDQGAAVDESSSAFIQIRASIRNIARGAFKRQASIQSLQDNAANGMGIMERVTVAVDNLVATLASMRDVTQVIHTIASRTNLKIAKSNHEEAGLNASTRTVYEDIAAEIAGVSVAMEELVSGDAELSTGTGEIMNGTGISVAASGKVYFETKALLNAIGSIREAKSMMDTVIS